MLQRTWSSCCLDLRGCHWLAVRSRRRSPVLAAAVCFATSRNDSKPGAAWISSRFFLEASVQYSIVALILYGLLPSFRHRGRPETSTRLC